MLIKIFLILNLFVWASAYSNEIPEELMDDFGIELDDSDSSSIETVDELSFDEENESESSDSDESLETEDSLSLDDLSDEEEDDDSVEDEAVTIDQQNKNELKKIMSDLAEKTKEKKELHTVLLKAGSYLEPVKEGLKEFITPRNSFVKIEYLNSSNPVVYIFNKDTSEIYYKTQATNIEPLKDDLEVHANPKQFNTYKPTIRWQEKNKELNLDSRILIHSSTYTPEYLEVISNLEETQATSSRFEFQTFYNWDSPYDFGLSISYENGVWSTDLFDGAWNTIYFGPMAKAEFGLSDSLNIYGTISYQKSFVWNLLIDTENNIRLSNNLFEVAGGLKYHIKYFNLVLSANYQSIYSHYKEGFYPLRKDFETGHMSSLSVAFGVGIDINL